MVFLGTSVVSGTATALVLATGARDAFGDIATRLATRAARDRVRARHRAVRLPDHADGASSWCCSSSSSSIAMHRDALESLLFAVALAVGSHARVPADDHHGDARAAARSRWRASKVIVKHLAAIQNFGSIDILCSDKTGTLTAGEMSSMRALDALGAQPSAGAPGSPRSTAASRPASEPARRGDPRARRDAGRRRGYTKIDEIPFDFERRRLRSSSSRTGERLLITKGAPEGDPRCARTAVGAAPRSTRDGRAQCRSAYRGAERARASACSPSRTRDVAGAGRLRRADERDLVLAGFLAFADPPLRRRARRDRRAAARRRPRSRSSPATTSWSRATSASEVGHRRERDRPGRRDRADDATPRSRTSPSRRRVFARVSPAQKNRIILALKRRRPRRRLPRRRHQRRAVAPRGRRRHLRRRRGRCRARRRRHHPARTRSRRAARGHPRGAQGVRQRHEVPAHGHQLELRQHVQHGGRVAVPAVPADAADADPPQQLPLRPRAGHDPDRQRGPDVHPQAAALGHPD